MNTTKSQALYSQACMVMPGGVSSPVRAFNSVDGKPLYYKSACGSSFVDEDDNSFVDFCQSWGPLILGHAYTSVVEAVGKAIPKGLSYGACCKEEIDLARLILEAFPEMEKVRFVSSGTEAVMTAIRLSRGVTGRDRILKFEGGYHGHSDSLLVKAGSGLVTFGTSSSAGVPKSFTQDTVVCPFDDTEQLKQVFQTHGEQLAAVIVEPLPANNGLLKQHVSWLTLLRELCTKYGSLLIFDEVISGFRLHFGGYGQQIDVTPDIITLGKIIGGGMPVGALISKASIMDHLAPVGNVYQAGTLSGNPIALSAGIATLTELQQGNHYQILDDLGHCFDEAIAPICKEFSFVNYRRVGSIIWMYLAEGVVPRQAHAIDDKAAKRYRVLHAGLLEAGFYLAPSAYEVAFLSSAHTLDEIKGLVAAMEHVIRKALA